MGVRKAASGLLFALALFAVTEAAARLLRLGSWGPAFATEENWLEVSPELGWRRRPGFRGVAFGAARAFDEEGFFTIDSPAVRGDRRRRRLVLLLGDSRTFGNGVAVEETFGEVLERSLPGIDVVNLSVPGHSSLQGAAALRIHAPRLRPDVVVFSYGFNDRRYALDSREADGEARFRRLAGSAAWTRLAGSLALMDLLRGSASDLWEKDLERPLDLGTVVPRVSPEGFRRHLEEVARFCAERRIRLVFLLLNDNPVESGGLTRGLRSLRQGRLAAAEAELRAAIASESVFSDAARLALARLYERTGRSAEAAATRWSPRTFISVSGGYPILSNGDYRAITLRVAEQNGVRIVDAGRVIDRHPEWYFDFCHFDRAGHRAVAGLLQAELARVLPPLDP